MNNEEWQEEVNGSGRTAGPGEFGRSGQTGLPAQAGQAFFGERRGVKRGAAIGLAVGLALGICASFLAPKFLQLSAGAEETFTVEESAAASGGGSAVNRESMAKLEKLEQYIRSYYYEPEEIDVGNLEDGMYKGLMNSLGDPYTVYYNEEEYSSLMEETSGVYGGIGAYIGIDKSSNSPVLSKIMQETPAEKAGLKKGDIICEVDGTDALSMQTDEVAALVKGPVGTKVTLKILRGEEYLDITVTRARINIPTVTYEMHDDGVGYLTISMFSDQTSEQFERALANLRKEGMTSLLLDLRGNPGGTVTSVTQIASSILPKGRIFYMEDKDGRREEYKCPGADFDLPIVVLVDGYTASASEILAGAIQDAGIGKLVGTRTYGKGVVQNLYSLGDGSAVKITIADYYTRDGRSINKQGLEPDYEVEFDSELYGKDETDNQLQKATAILLGKGEETAEEKEKAEKQKAEKQKAEKQKEENKEKETGKTKKNNKEKEAEKEADQKKKETEKSDN